MKNKVIKLINQSDLESKKLIKSLLLPGIGFKLTERKTHLSGIGGYPPIPDSQWPVFNGEPLTFLGQISLKEIASLNDLLPRSGMLCFFIYTGDKERFPGRKGEFKVLYVEEKDILTSASGRVASDDQFDPVKEYGVSFFDHYTFPSYQDGIVEKNDLSDDDLDIISDIEWEVRHSLGITDHDTIHQVLGHPHALQGTVRLHWAAAYCGIDIEDTLTEEELERTSREEDHFILLLQLDFGDPAIEIDAFGDSVAYFGIHKDDLMNLNFENVILVMQNT